MKEEFDRYFSAIDISSVVKQRIQDIYNEIKVLYNLDEIDDVLVCDVITNGTRNLINLWFFHANIVIECKDFIDKDDFDLAQLDKNVAYFNIKKQNYKLENEFKADSSIVVDVVLNFGGSCNLMGTGANCKYVTDIARKYFVNKIISQA